MAAYQTLYNHKLIPAMPLSQMTDVDKFGPNTLMDKVTDQIYLDLIRCNMGLLLTYVYGNNKQV